MVPPETAPAIPLSVFITLLALYGATLTAYISTAAFFGWRLGRVPTHQDLTELRDELKADNVQLRNELKAEIVQLREDSKADNTQLRREYKEEMAEFRREYKADMAEFRREHREDMAKLHQELIAEFRRSHQQLMLASVNHSHNEEGQAVFTAPPEMETTLSPADN